jgi:transcriptional antiterminator NusG
VSPASAAAPVTSWFALRVRSRSESMVSVLLAEKGYQSYSPGYAIERRYSDRIKRVEAALFPGYVFCRFSPAGILPILSTPAVQKVVGMGSRPEPIPDAEMERLRLGVRYGQGVAPCAHMRAGQRVRVRSGVLAGIEGFLVEVRKSRRLVITADILQRAVSVEIDASNLVSF